MARAADTNVIVRLIARDDPKQLALALAAASSGLWVSHVVLVEAAWVLESTYGRERRDIATALELLLGHPDLTVQDPDVVRASIALFRGHRGVDFADCLILEVARKAGHGPLLTFDRALGKMDGVQRLSR
jgi:predicted nucleic-acid-binding protein